MNYLKFVLFIAVFLLIYLGMHYYVYIRIVRGLELKERASGILKYIFLAGTVSYVVGRVLTGYLSFKPVLYMPSVWMGIISIFTSIFVINDIAGLVFQKKKRARTAVSCIVAVILIMFSICRAQRGPVIKRITLDMDLLRGKEFVIAHLSDLHLGEMTSMGWLEKVVRMTNSLYPDLIVITGDLLDGDIRKTEEICRVLKKLKSRNGVYAVSGNHEYYVGLEKFGKVASASRIKILRNENVGVTDDIYIAGIDDSQRSSKTEITSNLKKAIKGINRNKAVILLSHQPDVFDEAVELGVDIQLSGHTHAGQLPPLDMIVLFCFKYPCGLYRKMNSFIYTTSGTGTWGPPMRLFSDSEIVAVTLRGRDFKLKK